MSKLRTKRKVQNILGWPTDTLSIDYSLPNDTKATSSLCRPPHTAILFIPGNPGCIEWYQDLLYKTVQRLGVGYAARAVSYAGHGVGKEVVGTAGEHLEALKERKLTRGRCALENGGKMLNFYGSDATRNVGIAWNMDGQIDHKFAWMDMIVDEMDGMIENYVIQSGQKEPLPKTRFVFLSHSIGSHLVQALLCRTSSLLLRTQCVIHLMPFIRFDPPPSKRRFLSTFARHPELGIQILQSVARVASSMPDDWMDWFLKNAAGLKEGDEGRKFVMDLFRQVAFARNHLELGFEEIRNVPKSFNTKALNTIGSQCPTIMLYCQNDHWAPYSHKCELDSLRQGGEVPWNLQTVYKSELRHDFVVHPKMIQPVVDLCVNSIEQTSFVSTSSPPVMQSKL